MRVIGIADPIHALFNSQVTEQRKPAILDGSTYSVSEDTEGRKVLIREAIGRVRDL